MFLMYMCFLAKLQDPAKLSTNKVINGNFFYLSFGKEYEYDTLVNKISSFLK